MRKDAGRKSKRNADDDSKPLSEAAFIKRRRQSQPEGIGSEAKATVDLVAIDHDMEGAAGFSEKQRKCLDAQIQKEKRQKVQALMEGSLLEDEVTPDVRAAMEAEKAARFRRAQERQSKQLRVQAAIANDSLAADFQNQKVYVVDLDEADRREVERVVTSHHHKCTVVRDRSEAEVFVCKKPSDPGCRAKLYALCNGCYVVTGAAWGVGGTRAPGPVLKYKAAKKCKQRVMYFTAKFRTKHVEMVKILEEVAASQGAGLKVLPLEDIEDSQNHFC